MDHLLRITVRGPVPNGTIPNRLCTLETCSLAQSNFLYLPSLGGNVFYVILFSLLLVVQCFLGLRYRTWGFLIGMSGGLSLEVIGYIARVQMHFNPFLNDPFLMYLICLTIGPTFLAAAIYLCFSRILVVYSESISRVTPRTVTIIFMSSDIFSLVLQAVGGAIADTAATPNFKQTGVNLMVAGLSLQVGSLVLFLALCADFGRRAWIRRRAWTDAHAHIRPTKLFKLFLGALLLATIVILIRSSFRVAELSGGFHGSLWNDQVSFMVLDGAMVSLAAIGLTVFHPGRAFQGTWLAADWKVRRTKQAEGDSVYHARYHESLLGGVMELSRPKFTRVESETPQA